VPADSPAIRAFVRSVSAWCRGGNESDLSDAIRLPYSRVPHDAAAAYATFAARGGGLLEAIEGSRLGMPAHERDAALAFADRARKLRARGDDGDDALRAAICDAFGIEPPATPDAPAERRETIALARAAQPEKPHGVAWKQKHFSASSLNAYVECSRKWFYRYACGAVEDPGSSAAAYGTAFHLALEDFHAEFPRPRASDEAQMRSRIDDCLKWAFERNRDGFETAVEFELQSRRARRTAQRYVDWLLVQERTAPFEVIGREVPADVELDGFPFVGYIDRLDRDERSQTIGVVDYKTGSIPLNAADYRDKVRRYRDFQLPFYYWARTAAGDRVTRLALIPLKDATLDVRPIVLEVVQGQAPEPRRGASDAAISVDDLGRAKARMVQLSAELAGGTVSRFAVTEDAAACSFCAYATACAGKPDDPPERFDR
jgi:RecB family exonuclease